MGERNRTIIGSYTDHSETRSAINKLKDVGYADEDITVYADRGFNDIFEDVQNVNVESQPNEDLLLPYKGEISKGNIVVVVDNQQNNDSRNTEGQTVRTPDLTDNDEESNAKSRGFGPDTVGENREAGSAENNFNADAIDPREVSSDNIHNSKITNRGMNTNPTGKSSTSDIEDQTGDVGSTNRKLTVDDIGRDADMDTIEENTNVDSSEQTTNEDNMRQGNREGAVKDGYNREPIDYGVNADPTGRTLSPNATDSNANVSPFTNDINKDLDSRNNNLDFSERGNSNDVDDADQGNKKPIDADDLEKNLEKGKDDRQNFGGKKSKDDK